MDRVDAVVIGGGVVGLAIARALALEGRETILVEKNGALGAETSSRNSEVIHAGMYYEPGSLKARACVRGRKLIYAYCAAHQVAHRRIGKLIVATSEAERAKLDLVAARAKINGLDGEDALEWLGAAEAARMEPAVSGVAALYSPSTGIVDSHGLMLAYRGDFEAAGGAVALNARALGAKPVRAGFEVEIDGEGGERTSLSTAVLVNSAGHGASAFARAIEGLPGERVPETFYSRGCYFTLSGRAPFTHLIYPAPNEVSLGIHLTIDLGGQAKFGPDQEWVGSLDYAVDPARDAIFYGEIRRYFPGLADGALQPAYAGIRPKIQRPGGPPRDFLIEGPAEHGLAGLVNLFGIESPGLTSSLALAEIVAEKLEG